LGLFLEDSLYDGYLGEFYVVLANLPENTVDLVDNFFAAFDGVVVGFVEVVGGGIEKLNEAMGRYLGDDVVCILARNVELVVFHGC
jgi:hypothetical protein